MSKFEKNRIKIELIRAILRFGSFGSAQRPNLRIDLIN